jgi:hypothetical protein
MAVDFQGPQITSRTIKADTPSVAVGDTSDAYAALANGLATAGDTIGAALASIEPKSGDRLQAKIDKATAQGKDAKVARLTGRKERRDVRDTARAERIKKRNKEQLEITKQRQENKTNRFDERREDGNTPISSFSQVFDKFSTIAKKI